MLAALCLAMVFAIALSSYIALCYVSLSTSTRNVVNDHGLELAEAGIEQALYYNNNSLSGWNISTAGGITTVASPQLTMTSSGLEPTSGGPTPLNYGNGANGVVNVSYQYPAGEPWAIQSITSQGVMTLPTGTVTSGTGPTISRTLTFSAPTSASTTPTASAPLFVNAVAATSGVLKFNTGGTLDSYNSNPSATGLNKGSVCRIQSLGNTNWQAIGDANATPAVGDVFTATGPGSGTGTVYEDYNGTSVTLPSTLPPYINAGFSAVVLSADTTSGTATVKLMNADVHGFAVGYDKSSPASTNWLSYGVSGELVGSQTSSSTFIDSSRILTSPVPYQPIFSEVNPLPSPTVLLNSVTTSMTLGTAGASTPTVYDANSLTLAANTQITVVGPVVLIMYGAISITGNGTAGIYLTTSTASLQIFQQYGGITLGAYGITNSNSIGTTGYPPLPKRVCILSTVNSSFTATISMTHPLYGTIYLPYMPITVSSSALIYGSLVGSAVSFTGAAPTVHYDNALRSPDTAVGDAAFANITAPMTLNSLYASVP